MEFVNTVMEDKTIKSEINKEKKSTNNYPVLKIYNHKETGNVVIVLFDEPKSGVWLYNKLNPNKVGEYSNNISEYAFKDFDGELILKNKE